MPRRAKAIQFETSDVVVGFGEVQSKVQPCGRISWILPGRSITFCKEEAQYYAKRLDEIVRFNVKRTKTRLV